jgi:hypothetical protein
LTPKESVFFRLLSYSVDLSPIPTICIEPFGPVRNIRHRRTLATLILRYLATSCSFIKPLSNWFGAVGGLGAGGSTVGFLAGGCADILVRCHSSGTLMGNTLNQ